MKKIIALFLLGSFLVAADTPHQEVKEATPCTDSALYKAAEMSFMMGLGVAVGCIIAPFFSQDRRDIKLKSSKNKEYLRVIHNYNPLLVYKDQERLQNDIECGYYKFKTNRRYSPRCLIFAGNLDSSRHKNFLIDMPTNELNTLLAYAFYVVGNDKKKYNRVMGDIKHLLSVRAPFDTHEYLLSIAYNIIKYDDLLDQQEKSECLKDLAAVYQKYLAYDHMARKIDVNHESMVEWFAKLCERNASIARPLSESELNGINLFLSYSGRLYGNFLPFSTFLNDQILPLYKVRKHMPQLKALRSLDVEHHRKSNEKAAATGKRGILSYDLIQKISEYYIKIPVPAEGELPDLKAYWE